MQIEDQIRHKFQISHYVNHVQKIKALGKEKKLYLHLSDDHMLIKEEDRDAFVDRFFFKEMSFIYLVQKVEKDVKKEQKKQIAKEVKRYILYIKEKSHPQVTTSFRHNQLEACKLIQDFVNNQIELKSDANQFQTLVHKRNVINLIKAKEEAIYRPIYEKYREKGLFSDEWLDSFLFEDHEKIVQYNILARQKANENERELILTKMRAKMKKGTRVGAKIEIPLQNYDYEKINEGTRFHDDFKKVSFDPKEQDKEEDLIVEALPNQEKYHFVDSLSDLKLIDCQMEIESGSKNKVSLDVEKTYEKGIKLPRPEKDKYKLMQRRGIDMEGHQISGFSDRSRANVRDFNEVVAKRIKIWIKIFYKIQSHSQLRRDHITAIEAELNTLLNSEPKLPTFLQRAIQKTQKNILEWKRNENNIHLY